MERRRGLQTVDDSMNTIYHSASAKIDDQAKFQFGQPKVCEKLCLKD